MERGTAAVTRPAPARRQASEAMLGAPAVPKLPPTMRTWPNLPLFELMGRGASVSGLAAPAQWRFWVDWTAVAGEPMSATTTGPKTARVRWPKMWASFGAVKVTTASARQASGEVSELGVGVPAAGKVYGDDGDGECGEDVAEVGCGAAEGRLETGADEGVEDEVGLGEEVGKFFAVGGEFIGELFDDFAGSGGFEGAEGEGGFTVDVRLAAGEQDAETDAGAGEDACGDQTVAAVVALASDDHHL